MYLIPLSLNCIYFLIILLMEIDLLPLPLLINIYNIPTLITITQLLRNKLSLHSHPHLPSFLNAVFDNHHKILFNIVLKDINQIHEIQMCPLERLP